MYILQQYCCCDLNVKKSEKRIPKSNSRMAKARVGSVELRIFTFFMSYNSTGTPPLTWFFRTQKNRVKGKPRLGGVF